MNKIIAKIVDIMLWIVYFPFIPIYIILMFIYPSLIDELIEK